MKPSTIIAVVVIIALPIIAFALTRNSSSTPPQTQATPSTNPAIMSTNSAQANPAAASHDDWTSATKVILKTDKGDIHLTLFPDKAPKTVTNFVTLGKRGYYDGIIFHRVIKNFVIQAGDPTGTGSGGSSIYGPTFEDEISGTLSYTAGTLAMANAGPNTNGSQFFICTQDVSLPSSYTVFGMTDPDSMAVVSAIAAVPTDSGDKPLTPIHITGFTVVQ